MENLHNNLTATSPSNNPELFNLSMLEEMDDKDYLVEVLTIFLEEGQSELKQMKDALHNRKTDIICQKAHKMKGSSGVIRADKFTEYLNSIEILGKAGTINDELITLVANAGQYYNRLEHALRKHIKELN